MMDLRDKRVLVMGLGLHGGGLGVTRWLVRQGAQVIVTDLKKPNDLTPTLRALEGLPVEWVLGEHRDSDFANADLIIRNPGVPRESRFLAIAREHGIPIRMEMGLFFERLPGGTQQVIGITGTKGKSTTTLMVGEILKQVDARTVVAGNLRVSALELLDQIDLTTPVVLELSSFQLEEFDDLALSPQIAAITNILPDHLNRYRRMEDYAAAKINIFRHQGVTDTCILNFDNSILTRLRPLVPSQVIWFSRLRRLNDGAYLEDDSLTWNRRGERRNILPADELGTPGKHNVENALAAIAVASVWGATPGVISETLRKFKGAPHRLEAVRELDGVTYVNDTTATTPVAAEIALRTLARPGINLWLLAGGADKGLDYSGMAHTIAEIQPEVLLLEGSATDKLEHALEAANAQARVIGRFHDLREAVERARESARRGDIVLLSPGAASFGMFANEFDRGDQFREIVEGF